MKIQNSAHYKAYVGGVVANKETYHRYYGACKNLPGYWEPKCSYLSDLSGKSNVKNENVLTAPKLLQPNKSC